ncbi:hypothetical protein [Pseudomonas sp. 2835]|uniref:hypothetical protein n=1 Tax=Pseudomonas sp. 2835 TaxID=3156451 RepID=UPI003D19C742
MAPPSIDSKGVALGIDLRPKAIPTSEHFKILSLGVRLSSFYSSFWSTSNFHSPQVFLFNQPDNFDISVPADDLDQIRTAITKETSSIKTKVVTNRQPYGHPLNKPRVYWQNYESTKNTQPNHLLAYIDVDLTAERIHIKGADSEVNVATLLDLSQANDYERTMEWSIYDHFTLVAPSGQVLIGALWPESPLHEGINFKPEGLVFKLVNHNGPGKPGITPGFTFPSKLAA